MKLGFLLPLLMLFYLGAIHWMTRECRKCPERWQHVRDFCQVSAG